MQSWKRVPKDRRTPGLVFPNKNIIIFLYLKENKSGSPELKTLYFSLGKTEMPTFSHHLCNASFQVKLRRLKQAQYFLWKLEARYLSKDLGAEAVLSVGLSKFARQKKRVAIFQFSLKTFETFERLPFSIQVPGAFRGKLCR